MSDSSRVTVDRSEAGIAVLTFSARPVNLYSAKIHDDLDAALDAVEADLPRALLIRAEGKLDLYDRMLELPERICALDIPTFFAAHALALTWAFEVALACDIIIASERAKFGLVERVIGLTPTMGGTQRLAARAGVGRAKEFVFTGNLYDAATLADWNAINHVLPTDGFDGAVLDLVRHVAVGPTRAFGAAKQILRHFEAGGVPEAIAHTTTIASSLFDTDDLQHGMESFLADGPGNATFLGR